MYSENNKIGIYFRFHIIVTRTFSGVVIIYLKSYKVNMFSNVGSFVSGECNNDNPQRGRNIRWAYPINTNHNRIQSTFLISWIARILCCNYLFVCDMQKEQRAFWFSFKLTVCHFNGHLFSYLEFYVVRGGFFQSKNCVVCVIP